MSTIPLHAQDQAGCWSRIGIAGDQSCERLAQHVHCRNCEVYAGSAQRNLDRPVSAEYLRDWAAHFREPEAGHVRQDRSAVIFRIGREWLSLPTEVFVEVAPIAQPHRIPHRNARGLRGVVNVNGTLYPCVGLAELFGMDEEEGAARRGRHTFPRLLLVQWEDQAFALPAADLYGIVRYAEAEVQAAPTTINKGLLRYLNGVLAHEDMQVGCLDAGLVGHQLARTLR
jgi:chemotaxis-related protein WspD